MATDHRRPAFRTYFPVELIPDIARRLTSLQDFFSLRATCRAYRAVLPPSAALLAAQPPLLLAPQLLVPNSSPSLALVHLPLRRLLRARLPLSYKLFTTPYTCVTSDGGRIFAVDTATRELVISHLLGGEQIRIPGAPNLSSHALLAGDLLLYFSTNSVRYCRLGDGIWRRALWSNPFRMHDLRYVNRILYAVSHTCQLAVAELLDDSLGLTLLGGEVDKQVQNARRESMATFWLGDCAGDLLLVFLVEFSVPAYKIFRWEQREKKWARILSLGGHALFVSNRHVDAWLGPDYPRIRGDCIYSTQPFAGGWSEYSLADGSTQQFTVDYQGAPKIGYWRPHLWLLPSKG